MTASVRTVRDLVPGEVFPDVELPDVDGHRRRLSELAGGDPLVLHTYRGWWCPKERAYARELVRQQDGWEVSYIRVVSISVDPPQVMAAYRAGLDARWTFLSDAERSWLPRLGLQELTDTVHDPYLPTVWVLHPDLTVHRWWNGYWYAARPSPHELRAALREVGAAVRPDWEPPRG